MGRRSAGVKFYRLNLITAGTLAAAAALAHFIADERVLAALDAGLVAATALVYFVLRYPKRLVYRSSAVIAGLMYLSVTVLAFHEAVSPRSLVWSLLGAVSAVAILGSVNLAMILGHWYLVVRGMEIEPLKRLTIAALVSTLLKCAVVGTSLASAGSQGFEQGSLLYQIVVSQGIFFWMRVGWGLAGPLVLYPMIWGTVKIRSTMAATGILYVAVVAVVIGEVLGGYLSALFRLPL